MPGKIRTAHVAVAAALVVTTWSGATWAAQGEDAPGAPGLTSKSEYTPPARALARGSGPAWLYKSRKFTLSGFGAGGGIVKCGKRGYKAVSGGVQTPTLEEIVNESRPYDTPGGDNMPDNGWIGYVINPNSNDIWYRVYVVCHK